MSKHENTVVNCTQATTLKTWAGKPENVKAAQDILVALAKANSEAQRGESVRCCGVGQAIPTSGSPLER
jgi:hypothetical protein